MTETGLTDRLPPSVRREKPQRFVAELKLREIVRAEIKQFTDNVLAPGIATAIGALVRECELRCATKLAALEERMSQPPPEPPATRMVQTAERSSSDNIVRRR